MHPGSREPGHYHLFHPLSSSASVMSGALLPVAVLPLPGLLCSLFPSSGTSVVSCSRWLPSPFRGVAGEEEPHVGSHLSTCPSAWNVLFFAHPVCLGSSWLCFETL